MRDSYRDFANSRKNVIKNIGYDYRGQIFRRTLSRRMFVEPKAAAVIDAFDDLMVYIIDSIKIIKRTANYTFPRNYRDFN